MGDEKIAADHECRVSDRAFDEGVFAHAAWRVQCIEPVLIGAHPILKIMAREKANVAADSCQSGISVECGSLRFEARTEHPIIGVHARHILPTAVVNSVSQCGNESAMGAENDFKPWIVSCGSLGDLGSTIGGSVIHHDAFPICPGLSLHATQAKR
jgi:hypothetical protein